MEIEEYKKHIGKYIRNKYGIAKILDVFKENEYIYIKLDNNIVFDVYKETGEINDKFLRNIYPILDENKIKNRIKDIIDLIEVNDIIVTKHPAFEKIYFEYIWSDEYLKRTKDSLNEKKLILLQILTHEQFEQNCYRLEENNV